MSNNKQSSVEWLEIELEKLWIEKYLSPITIKPLIEQAKAMHKKEIVEAYYIDNEKNEGFEYYNAKFGGSNE
jgi:hypothetical protein